MMHSQKNIKIDFNIYVLYNWVH